MVTRYSKHEKLVSCLAQGHLVQQLLTTHSSSRGSTTEQFDDVIELHMGKKHSILGPESSTSTRHDTVLPYTIHPVDFRSKMEIKQSAAIVVGEEKGLEELRGYRAV